MPYQRRTPTAASTPDADPALAHHLVMRGLELMREEQYRVAVEFLTEAVKVDPSSVEAAEALEAATALLDEAELEAYRRSAQDQEGRP
jgi:hypothetical protein